MQLHASPPTRPPLKQSRGPVTCLSACQVSLSLPPHRTRVAHLYLVSMPTGLAAQSRAAQLPGGPPGSRRGGCLEQPGSGVRSPRGDQLCTQAGWDGGWPGPEKRSWVRAATYVPAREPPKALRLCESGSAPGRTRGEGTAGEGCPCWQVETQLQPRERRGSARPAPLPDLPRAHAGLFS